MFLRRAYKYGIINEEPINLAINFKIRVLADGGIFESGECLTRTLQEMDVLITDPIAILANSFNNRVIEDSGEFESKQCLFETLQEIDIL